MNYICAACIGEPVLQRLVLVEASSANTCDYCDREQPAAEVWFVAQKCDMVIATFYELSSQTMAVVHFDRTPAGTDLETTIQELVQVPRDALEAIVETLQFMWYDSDSEEHQYGDEDPWFVLRTRLDSPLSEDWIAMESSLRGEARYLNPKVNQFMESVFGGITEDVAANGTSVLVDAGRGSTYDSLYRARVFQSEKSLNEALQHPERFLGAPAAGIGAGGRMNAAGQPAFYGATDVWTTLAEVRPPVGSWVVVAKFSVIRALKLLDLTLLGQVQLREEASLFDPATKFAAHRRDFLRVLSEKMIVPVMPESQDHNYLITQVVADYLAMHPSSSIDGIVYPSVQRSGGDHDACGVNIALFHKAATAIGAHSEKATAQAELWEYEEDGPRQYFQPTILYHPDNPQYFFRPLGFHPEPALQLIRDSIEIHRVQSVDIRTKSTLVEVVNLDETNWHRR
ncbi:RES family NAD+ phosphorylase [Variovorax sp. E3]|uniref:RES family NAD+ phosphorylase n=1 Tax=Variovorax sp. E3 TaxID=1914993 RepID=UPI0018DE1172|nr:RES family NAD+ phosphorylase [Variovorax sp. E3]